MTMSIPVQFEVRSEAYDVRSQRDIHTPFSTRYRPHQPEVSGVGNPRKGEVEEATERELESEMQDSTHECQVTL